MKPTTTSAPRQAQKKSGPRTAGGDDPLLRIDEDGESGGLPAAARPWLVLIVDDDRSVHEATLLALRNARVHGRPLQFLHAYSGSEARQIVAGSADLALILLDVVMETEDAGLRLVTEIREQLQRRDLRILIRTGQPGYAPEADVKRNYAIDGYLMKARMTGAMLLDSLARVLGDADARNGGPARAERMHRTEILVVEDNPHDAELTLHALRDVVAPGAVAVVEDGAAAIDWFFGADGLLAGGKGQPPRVVFVDLKLPRVDGLAVIRRLKSEPRTQAVPLVVLTSSAEQGDVGESYRLGANGYLVKPVAYDQYMALVSQAGRYWTQVNFDRV